MIGKIIPYPGMDLGFESKSVSDDIDKQLRPSQVFEFFTKSNPVGINFSLLGKKFLPFILWLRNWLRCIPFCSSAVLNIAQRGRRQANISLFINLIVTTLDISVTLNGVKRKEGSHLHS